MRRFSLAPLATLALLARCHSDPPRRAPAPAPPAPAPPAAPRDASASPAPRCTPEGPITALTTHFSLRDEVHALGLSASPGAPPGQGVLVALTADELLATTRWSEPPRALGLLGARRAPGPTLALLRNEQGIYYVPLLRPGPPVPPQLVFAALDAEAQHAQEPPALALDDGDGPFAVHSVGAELEAAWATLGAVAMQRVGSSEPRQLVGAGTESHALELARVHGDTLLAWSDTQDGHPVLRLAARHNTGPLRLYNVAPLPAPVSVVRLLVAGSRVFAVTLEQGAAGASVPVRVTSYRAVVSDAGVPFTFERDHDYVELGRALAGGALLVRAEGAELQALTHSAGDEPLQLLRLDTEAFRPLAARPVALAVGAGTPGALAWHRTDEGTVLALARGREVTVARFDARGCMPGAAAVH